MANRKHGDFEELFSQEVRKKRKAIGMSQSDLAFICGVHRATIAGIENGINMPTFARGIFIARILNIDLNKLPLSKDEEEIK